MAAFAEEEGSQLKIVADVGKYKNFWVGVNRGIYLESKNPKVTYDPSLEMGGGELKRSKGLFAYDGTWRVLWSVYITLLIVYSAVIISLRLGFEPQVTYPFEVLENLILASFTLDILISFNTTFPAPGSEQVVHSRRLIALNYLQFWFWIDLLSTIPFTEVGSWLASTDVSALRALRILRLLRVFKLLRINKLKEVLQNSRVNQHLVNLLVLLLGIFFVAHLFACGWHFMALEKEQSTGGETWANVLGFAESSVYDLYVASLYYVMVTMMTVGFGDIHPVTDNERMYAIATMLTGGVVFGAMISRLMLILEKRNPQAKALRQNLTELKSYLVDIRLAKDKRRQIVDAYKYYLHKKSVFGEPTFFEDLPQPILFRLVRQLNEDDMRRVKLFHTYEMEFVVVLLLALKPFQAMAGEVIFSEGDICDAIVFLKRGNVSFSSSHGNKVMQVGSVRAGGYFGDMEYLRNTTCIATYTASDHSQLLSVSHNTLRQAAERCLAAGVRFCQEAEQRCKQFHQVIKLSKRAFAQNVAQHSLDEARIVVDQLMRPANGPLLSQKGSPRRGVRKTLFPPFGDANVTVSEVEPKKCSKSISLGVMWIDGVVVDTHEITSNHQQVLLPQTDVTMVRVIYRNRAGEIGPGEVPESYLSRALIVSPLNRYKITWDLLIAAIVVFSVVVVPMEVAFNTPVFAASQMTETITDAFYLLDVLINFRTGYFEDEGDYLVIVPSLVAKHYLFTWCFVDLVGSLPFDAMFQPTKLTQLLKIVRLTRLLKVFRLFKFGTILEEMEDRLGLSPAAMSLFVLLLQVFFVGHLMACILYGFSSVITPNPWYQEDTTAYPSQADATFASKYILSLYWAFTIMSTVGYGDILPNNTAQRLLCIFVILLGASMFGYMLANVSSLIQSFTSTDTVKDERIAGISVYLDEKQTPLKLQDTVIKHFRNYFKHASPFDVDAMLGRLPQRLANEILLIHNGTTLKSIAILRYIENVSVRLYIFNLMKPVYYEPNEYMLRQGSPGQEILFLVEGGALAFKKTLPRRKHELTSSTDQQNRFKITTQTSSSLLPEDPSESENVRGAALLTTLPQHIEEGSAKNVYDVNLAHADPAHLWSESGILKKGFRRIGALAPGNFVGHLAVMHDSTNDASVLTTTFSTVYVLQKQDVSSILTTQPSVSLQLQTALSRAISTQSDMLGTLHMRQNRSKFLFDCKETFYSQLAVRPKQVKQIRSAKKFKMKRMVYGVKGKVRRPSDQDGARTGPVRMRGAQESYSALSKSEVDRTMHDNVSEATTSRCSIMFGRFSFSRRRVLPKAVVRKVERLEDVLTKQSALYDSGEEDRDGSTQVMGLVDTDLYSSKTRSVYAHRPPLPPKVTLRATAFPPVTSTWLEKGSPTKRRRGSFSILSNPTTTDVSSDTATNRPNLSTDELRTSSNSVTTTDRHSVGPRLFPKRPSTTKKGKARRERVMSLSDLDALEPPSTFSDSLIAPSDSGLSAMHSNCAPIHETGAEIVPTYSNHIAIRRSIQELQRRQSFPSLENELWKIGVTNQGLL